MEISKYIVPQKDKIRNYNKILSSGNVVVRIRKYKNGEKTTIGRLWENQFGGGTTETHIIGNEYEAGDFILNKEVYNSILQNAAKI